MLKRTHIRVLSLLLVLSMMLSVMPSASAVTTEQEMPALSEEPLASAQVTEPLVLDEQSVPAVVGLETAQERGHVLRMHEEEQGALNKLIFLNEDGSRTMYLYDHPVKYVDKNGTVKDISLEIADTGDAAQPFRTASGAAVTTFSANLSGGITLSGNSNTLRLVPITSGRARTASRLDAQTIQYSYGTHTTIEYSLTYTGFKEDIVVSQYTGQTEYPFTLYTNGLTLTEIDGSWYLTDGNGKIQATIGDIIVFTADERNNTMGALRAETVVPNQEYRMTIVLDPEYLADPNTVYPIRIDPTIEVVYDAEEDNANAILDMTLFSNGTSSINSGSLTVGNHETKGTARAVMSFPGLDWDDLGNIYVESATVYVRDLLCESAEQDIQCYVYTGTQWGSGSSGSSLNQTFGAQLDEVTFGYEIGYDLNPRHFYSFDITTAVRGWYSGHYSRDKGIIFRSTQLEETTTYQCRTLASYNRNNHKPHLEVIYSKLGEGITSANGKDYVVEGETLKLIANGMNGTVTWNSSNASVATISSDGTVTGLKAGKTIITASCPEYADSMFTLWVTVKGGIYYIKNASSNLCLSSGAVSTIRQQNTSEQGKIPQLWKITYLSYGYYSIRPLDDFSTALSKNLNSIGAASADCNDADVPMTMRWQIIRNTFGYFFTSGGVTANTLKPISANSPGSGVQCGAWESNSACHWLLEKASDVYAFDVFHYYDVGYTVREENALGMIKACAEEASERFKSIFNLYIFNNYICYTSVCDTCKINQFGSIDFSILDLRDDCPHTENCRTVTALRNGLIDDYGAGTPTTGLVLWTGHRMSASAFQRSNTVVSSQTIVMTVYSTWKWNDNTQSVEPKDDIARYNDNASTLMHELSHLIGARDHYCWAGTAEERPCDNPFCDICQYLMETRACLMAKPWIFSEYSDDELYCSDCIARMNAHLQDHH